MPKGSFHLSFLSDLRSRSSSIYLRPSLSQLIIQLTLPGAMQWFARAAKSCTYLSMSKQDPSKDPILMPVARSL